MTDDEDIGLRFREMLKAWQPPSADITEWKYSDLRIENMTRKIPACFCGYSMEPIDKYCTSCGNSNPSFDEQLHKLMGGESVNPECTTGHKEFIKDILAGEVEPQKFCCHCGGELFRPRLIK